MNPKIMVVGAFLITAGLGAFFIKFALDAVEDGIMILIGIGLIYLGAKVD